jgi:DNA-binding NarL/FixJ family response regulator
MNRIRVLIADDHPMFRLGLRMLLQPAADMEVVGEASTGVQTLQMAGELHPDVILMDINMPDMNGIEATRRITAAYPSTAVLVITMIDDDTVFSAMRAGAKGYLLKGAEGEDTMRAIRSVANGEVIFGPAAAERMLLFFTADGPLKSPEPFPELTPREREILELIAQGLTNSAIAERFVVSPKTVRNQVSSIFGKLQVRDRAQAIVKAREAGLGKRSKPISSDSL